MPAPLPILTFSAAMTIIEIMLIVFFVIFVGIIVWLFLFRRRKDYTRASQIPLEDDRVVTPRDEDRHTEREDPEMTSRSSEQS